MLKWNDMFFTGHKTVDEQHKKLFEMINDFETAILNKTAEASIDQTLCFLGSYVITHFQDEENEMERTGCPAAEENRQAHAAFIAVYKKFLERFKTQGYTPVLAYELLRAAQNWIIEHICMVDINLRSYPDSAVSDKG